MVRFVLIRKLKNFFHLFEAVVANLIYGLPAKKLKIIGVTGTDGKTTTTHLIYHILKTANKKVSMISTIYAKIGKKEYDTGLHTTTPSSFLIQKLLKEATENKDDFFVLEVTSHGLDQNRIWGINFYVAVLTNITHEHLDYHGSYQNYLNCKYKIFKRSKYAVLNKGDSSYKTIIKKIKEDKLKIDVREYNSRLKILNYIPNLTKFNKSNYAAAYTVAKILGIPDEIIIEAFKTFKLPKGRLEVVFNKDFKVIIDFAHTPNAFKQLLPEVRKKYLERKGRLIHVFGCAGLRDFTKREIMGEISAKFSDIIIITEEDYRTENPLKIASQISRGVEKESFKFFKPNKLNSNNNLKTKAYTIVLDRKEAINLAIKIARKNDIVLLTGKAHEKSLCRGKLEYPWDEFQAVNKSLSQLHFL